MTELSREEKDLAASAQAMLASCGIDQSVTGLSRISCGGNNRVFRLAGEKTSWLLKQYFRHPGDTRDRLAAEYGFLAFCARHKVSRVPLPVAASPEKSLGLYSFIDGTPFSNKVSRADVEEAGSFFLDLAALSGTPSFAQLPPASDACLSLSDHLERITKRLASLRAELAANPNPAPGAQQFVEHHLVPAWESAYERVVRATNTAERDARLPLEQQMPSPSDFGFHNALRRNNGLAFVDFEYAGRDDPAKALCDFLCQPEIPPPGDSLEHLLGILSKKQEKTAHLAQRVQLALPLHRIKWCCIILNACKKIEALRRTFAGKDQTALVRQRQLEKAQRYFFQHVGGL